MKRIFFFILFCFLSFQIFSQDKMTKGPQSGTLLIIGGHASDSLYLPIFKDLVGGWNQPIVIIPTARKEDEIQKDHFLDRQKKRFEKAGFTNVTILNTRSKEEANSEEFIKPLIRAKGVWIMGGRQWRLVDAYENTLTHLELISLLQRDGVIAGTSAGATIMGSYLVRGDTKTNTIMMGDHQKGFGFIRNIAIDQHLLARNRQFDMFRVLNKYPELLGLGLDENTGVIVHKDTLHVVGKSYVAVYDHSMWSAKKDTFVNQKSDEYEFYFLKNGDKYILPERKAIFKK